MYDQIDEYNDYAQQYSAMVRKRDTSGKDDAFMAQFLAVLGDVVGLDVLDAGCGEGYLSRILASRGAHVTGIDIASRLVELARSQDPESTVIYQVANLCQPLPALQEHFDLVASYFVLNDVYDYQGFLATLSSVVKPGGRVVFFMNSPYSYVVRSHITDYFDTNRAVSYRGMAEEGVKVHFYHRTLQEYLDACFAFGLRLERLLDIPTPEGEFKRRDDTLIPVGYHFPFFMILSLVKR